MSNQPKYDEVLQSPSKTVCVIAGPGSGKTKGILIPKAKQVLADESIDPNSVVLLTFSRPSAIDLKNRVKGMDRVPRALTLHSLCLSFLLSEDNHDIKKRINSIVLDFEKDALKADLKLQIPSKNKREIGKMLDEFSAGWAIQPHDTVFDENDEKRAFKRAILNWLDEHEAVPGGVDQRTQDLVRAELEAVKKSLVVLVADLDRRVLVEPAHEHVRPGTLQAHDEHRASGASGHPKPGAPPRLGHRGPDPLPRVEPVLLDEPVEPLGTRPVGVPDGLAEQVADPGLRARGWLGPPVEQVALSHGCPLKTGMPSVPAHARQRFGAVR